MTPWPTASMAPAPSWCGTWNPSIGRGVAPLRDFQSVGLMPELYLDPDLAGSGFRPVDVLHPQHLAWPGRGGRKAQLACLSRLVFSQMMLSSLRSLHARASATPAVVHLRSVVSARPCSRLGLVNSYNLALISGIPTTPDFRMTRGIRAACASDAPLLDAWLTFTARVAAGELLPMGVPGHKQRQDLTGSVVAGDAPLYGGLDTIKHADVPLADAEARAAALWGADWCRFSVAGSTHGNQALALAVGGHGQETIVTRILHRSLLLGLVLAGLRPVWVRPEIDPETGLPAAVAVATVRAALAEHPDACARVPRRPVLRGHDRRPGRACRRRARGRRAPGRRRRPGRPTSASTPTCRRTRSPLAPTRW